MEMEEDDPLLEPNCFPLDDIFCCDWFVEQWRNRRVEYFSKEGTFNIRVKKAWKEITHCPRCEARIL
jgi:hypothetical protein